MTSQSSTSPALPTPDRNADRLVPPVDARPAWVLPCRELQSSVDRFTAAGFSLLAIGPADDPRWALMSSGRGRGGTSLRLDVRPYVAGRRHPFLEVDEGDPLLQSNDGATGDAVVANVEPVTSSVAGNGDPAIPPLREAGATPEWVVGRAGMRYRDLLPGRWGGQFIASHIHIPDGGPVPDYVHYHHVDFQLIFCHRGWVRVVYQDQGEPFVLNAGDAVLQAPGLRHRVLEASDDLHVIEVSSPAEHATFVEHDLDLPNGSDPGGWYGGQRYVRHQTADSPWTTIDTGIRRQSLDLEPATGGRYAASVVELGGPGGADLELPFAGDVDFEIVTVLDGSLDVTDETKGEQATIRAGAAVSLNDTVTWTARADLPSRLLVISRHRI